MAQITPTIAGVLIILADQLGRSVGDMHKVPLFPASH